MIFETHAHYEDKKFDQDRDELLLSMKAHGISTIVNVGSSIEATRKSIQLADKYDFIYAAAGVHPSDIGDLNDDNLEWLRGQAGHPKVAAIGEIGLDYYWNKEEEVQAKQRYWFRRQLQLAKDAGLPVIIHSRDAAADTLAVMKEADAAADTPAVMKEAGAAADTPAVMKEAGAAADTPAVMKEAGAAQIPGVVHCFSYSVEMAEEYIRMGYYIGIGGVVTFKNAKKLKEVAAKIPLERILLETDCPYMAPEPYRGKRNSSLYLPYIAAEIAKIKGVSEQEVIEVTEQNAYRMYHKIDRAHIKCTTG